MRIRDLKGLGQKSEEMLADAGIRSVDDLKAAGAVEAFARVAANTRHNPSLNLLYALAGAISDRPWTEIAREERDSLVFALQGHVALDDILSGKSLLGNEP